MRFPEIDIGRTFSSISVASFFNLGPNFPDLAKLNALSSRAEMKFTAVKFKTISITSDDVITKRNTAHIAITPCTKRRMQANTIGVIEIRARTIIAATMLPSVGFFAKNVAIDARLSFMASRMRN